MGNSFILIIVGLLLFYLIISDKWQCVENFAGCVISGASNEVGAGMQPTSAIPQNSTLTPTFDMPAAALNTNWISYGF